MDTETNWKKYLIVFFITLGLFLGALYVSGVINDKKVVEIKNIQDKISLDILSSETQFALMEELACTDLDNSLLTQELSSLGDKIDYGERNLTSSTQDIQNLKEYYSLLEIKDYLLMKKVSERCNRKAIFVLYFYTTSENCSECVKQGYVLTELHQRYPELRVYSFDYGLNLSALKALTSIYKIEDTKLPALVINGKSYTGLKKIEDIEALVPELKDLTGESADTTKNLKTSTIKKTN
jgi:hypothetical protein